ncbi:MAG: IS630 family transposase [Desulfobacterales bacterium]
MNTQDGRKISPKAMEEIRIRAVQSVQDGESPEEVIKALGFSRACIYNWLARYRGGGWHALSSGKQSGRPSKLNGSHISWIHNTVRDKDPQQLKLPFALWTCSMVADVIKKKFGIKLSLSSVSRLLRQLGFSPQKPLHRAYQQNPEEVAEWKRTVFPEIKKRAKKLGAKIYFADESGVRSDYHAGRTWALKGQTPVVESTGARFSVNMIAAIDTRGSMRFMITKGTVNGKKVCEFLKKLMHDNEGPVFVIWDCHPTHKSKKVRDCIDSFDGRLEVYFLPSYSPSLNPAEQVFNNVKSHGAGRKAISGPDKFKSMIFGRLRKLQKLPRIIRSFFRHPECIYILS